MKNIFVLVVLLTVNSVFAQASDEQIKELLNNNNTYEPNYFSMVLGLFLVVGLIYLTGFLYQKLIKVNIVNSEFQINKAQILSTTSLGQGKNLHVVKIGNIACLIGATQNNITYLRDVEVVEIGEKDKKDDKNS